MILLDSVTGVKTIHVVLVIIHILIHILTIVTIIVMVIRGTFIRHATFNSDCV